MLQNGYFSREISSFRIGMEVLIELFANSKVTPEEFDRLEVQLMAAKFADTPTDDIVSIFSVLETLRGWESSPWN